MNIFDIIQQFLARSFGFALELPGQLVLSSKERLGVPTGLILKKYFELFGINFSLDVEILLKKGIHFELSASRDYRIFGVEITPSFSIGKYGISASLELGANNYYANLGVGFDRVPGFSIGLRRGTTGFDFSFGGGFADELQFYSGYKTFTVPLGIDFRGRDKEFNQIPEYSGFGAIEYRDNGAGVLVPINPNFAPFKMSSSSSTGDLIILGGISSNIREPKPEIPLSLDWRKNVNLEGLSTRNNAVISGRSVRGSGLDPDSPFFSKNTDEVTFYKSLRGDLVETILADGIVSVLGSTLTSASSIMLDLRVINGQNNPVYGVIERVSQSNIVRRLSGYGDTIIQLKSSVLNEAPLSWTVGDSFNRYVRNSYKELRPDDGTFLAKPFSEFSVSELNKVRSYRNGDGLNPNTEISYIEGQFDRKIVAEDISSIIFTGSVSPDSNAVRLANMLGIKTYKQSATGSISRLFPGSVPDSLLVSLNRPNISVVIEKFVPPDSEDFIDYLLKGDNPRNPNFVYLAEAADNLRGDGRFFAHVLPSTHVAGIVHSGVDVRAVGIKIELKESVLRNQGVAVTYGAHNRVDVKNAGKSYQTEVDGETVSTPYPPLRHLNPAPHPKDLSISDLNNPNNFIGRGDIIAPSKYFEPSLGEKVPRVELRANPSLQTYYAYGEFQGQIDPSDIVSVTYLTREPTTSELSALAQRNIPVYSAIYGRGDFASVSVGLAPKEKILRSLIQRGDSLLGNVARDSVTLGITPPGRAIQSEVSIQNRTAGILGRLQLSGAAARFSGVSPIRS